MLELVKKFHQWTGIGTRLRVLKCEEELEELTMTQLVDSSTPLPHPHSPCLFSPFFINQHGDYPLLDQILLNGPLLQQPWYNDNLPYTCQAAHCEAIDQEAQEQLATAAMAKLPYAIATLANNNNDHHHAEENNTCTHQNDCGALANLPSPNDGHASSSQVRQQAAPQHVMPQGSVTDAGDIPHHPVWHPHQAGCLPHITEESMDKQAGVAPTSPEVESKDTVTIKPCYLYSWNDYSPHDHSKGDALFDKADQTMD